MDKSGEYEFLNDLVRFDSLADLERFISGYCEKSFYAQTVTLISFQKDTKPITLLSHILDRDLAELFTTYYARLGFMLDPFYIVAFGEAEFTAHQLREIAPDKFKTSEYYAQYYVKTGLVDELGATIRLSPQVALHLSLGRIDRPRLMDDDQKPTTANATGSRPVMFDASQGFIDTPVIDRASLVLGEQVHGPAIITQLDSTVIVAPGETAKVAVRRTLLIDRKGTK